MSRVRTGLILASTVGALLLSGCGAGDGAQAATARWAGPVQSAGPAPASSAGSGPATPSAAPSKGATSAPAPVTGLAGSATSSPARTRA